MASLPSAVYRVAKLKKCGSGTDVVAHRGEGSDGGAPGLHVRALGDSADNLHYVKFDAGRHRELEQPLSQSQRVNNTDEASESRQSGGLVAVYLARSGWLTASARERGLRSDSPSRFPRVAALVLCVMDRPRSLPLAH